jgi:hypothetical protein
MGGHGLAGWVQCHMLYECTAAGAACTWGNDTQATGAHVLLAGEQGASVDWQLMPHLFFHLVTCQDKATPLHLAPPGWRQWQQLQKCCNLPMPVDTRSIFATRAHWLRTTMIAGASVLLLDTTVVTVQDSSWSMVTAHLPAVRRAHTYFACVVM